jgi:diguanylate cyclase (GGDEF)-like protein/PAS domain S-box-containing protein
MAAALARRVSDLVCLVDQRGLVRWASNGRAGGLAELLRGGLPQALEGPLGEREQDLWLELVDRALTEGVPVEGRLALPGGESLEAALSPLGPGLLLALLRVEGAPSGEPVAWPAAAVPAPAGLAEAAAAPPATSTPLLDAVAAALLGIDPQGRIRVANEAAERLLGVDRARLLDRPIESVLGGAESEAALRVLLLEQLPRGRGVRELQGRREEAEPLPLEVAAIRVAGPGEPLVLLTLRDATLARHTEETLRTLAYLDPLTGLPNRLLFMDRLGQAIARARRARQLLAVMLVDLDRFKLVNDSLGLERGDQLLKAVGERLVGTLRRSDTVARLASDEFVVLLTGLEQPDPIVKVAHKLLQALQAPLSVNGHELSPTASIGVAVYPHDGDEPSLLIKNADTALGRAKELGRSHVQFYTNDMNAQAFERLMLENRLRRALENGELVVYYQPQVSVRTGEVVGVEALVRWFHPELGLVPPAEFIPLAEETGLILPIGFWAMETACAQVQAWRAELDRPGLRLGVNLSARQFQHPELATRIAQILECTGFPATSLELELTESVVMREASESMRRMRDLTTLGTALAIDDFGTGYSSLAYLRSFPIRSLKIDRSFVQDVDRDPSSATIVQAIVAMGASLGLTVVAEGVETSQQLRQLRRMGCHEMQGFLVSRALPPEEVVTVIRDGRLEGEEFLLSDGG